MLSQIPSYRSLGRRSHLSDCQVKEIQAKGSSDVRRVRYISKRKGGDCRCRMAEENSRVQKLIVLNSYLTTPVQIWRNKRGI
jgi:hypothetical protein